VSRCKDCWSVYQAEWRKRRVSEKALPLSTLVCTECKKTKPASAFYRHPSTKTGRLRQCKDCRRQYIREYAARPGVRARLKRRAEVGHVSRTYGLTEMEFDALMSTKCCEICSKELADRRSKHIDHDHSTGQVRGVLCSNCNHMVGNAQESEEILLASIAYLRKYKKDLSKNEQCDTSRLSESTLCAPTTDPEG